MKKKGAKRNRKAASLSKRANYLADLLTEVRREVRELLRADEALAKRVHKVDESFVRKALKYPEDLSPRRLARVLGEAA